MCISAAVSYGAAAVLVSAGLYTVRQARRRPQPYRLWALIPVFFGVQQAFEGRVWQALASGNASEVVPFALGFHFFSHFLWLWYLPLCCYLVEPMTADKTSKIRRRIIGGFALFGTFAGTLVYSFMLFHPEWLSVAVREQSIVYNYSVPYRSTISIPLTPVMLYGLTILVPLLISSHRQIRIFGALAALSMMFASAVFNVAFVSVWCFFASTLSLYIAYMIRQFAAEPELNGSA